MKEREAAVWVEKLGISKEVWVMCPSCKKCFNVHQDFFSPKFASLKLYCPWCGLEFRKEESPKIW